ncbi:MAG: NADH-quinone oxidoreductase subunit I [Desulfitobacteriaceae bacterium]|nr:NADH-quinone oxidoreductase subunit I [Desulfitobacteriaceae bacterium]MDD4752721.1 NADH-quinone oxidoreductase subunit I [Desulfitobacteriaceae bacterium]
MNGQGLIKGLSVTIKHFFSPKITELYPEVKPKLPESVKADFDLDREKCIACGICANACPNKVITIETEKDENNKRRLKRYEMNMQYCLFCGLCAESCPTKAIITKQNFELAAYSRENTKRLLYQADKAPASETEPGAKE